MLRATSTSSDAPHSPIQSEPFSLCHHIFVASVKYNAGYYFRLTCRFTIFPRSLPLRFRFARLLSVWNLSVTGLVDPRRGFGLLPYSIGTATHVFIVDRLLIVCTLAMVLDS
jgi:hypothetical protein